MLTLISVNRLNDDMSMLQSGGFALTIFVEFDDI
ncbi:hypothetical protein SAMN04488691_1103 [Haloferax larsenii]|uniref:Uncharacterized protein n=1 Tax=Haloferax larsenii TaxID=302484 RepID=A0A1H7TPA7_HALLR|nr:hypothetical protein SAMN04488691_1103 [Haloferax larsenii]